MKEILQQRLQPSLISLATVPLSTPASSNVRGLFATEHLFREAGLGQWWRGSRRLVGPVRRTLEKPHSRGVALAHLHHLRWPHNADCKMVGQAVYLLKLFEISKV